MIEKHQESTASAEIQGSLPQLSNEPKIPYQVEVFTGIRPTGLMTVANYLGAVKPTLALQESGKRPLVFVADLHGLTTHETGDIKANTLGVIADYVALGLDPAKADLFIQSSIRDQIFELTMYLMRLISVAEICRVPTLKDKLRGDAEPETANMLLATYPVMMAADILIQRAHTVPVGEDQIAHIEITRKLARKFNRAYGYTFPLPDALERETPLRLLGLRGDAKMSKSNPDDAIFLTDTPEMIEKKIRNAQTAIAGEMNPTLLSNFSLARGLARTEQDMQRLADIETEHLAGKGVMGAFKNELSRITIEFVRDFQERRAKLVANSNFFEEVLAKGEQIARSNADACLYDVRKAMFG